MSVTQSKSPAKIPLAYQADIRRACDILKQGGCTEVYLFGSLTADTPGPLADIDLAIRGCPPGKFFHLLGQLLLSLDHPGDLVNLDHQDNIFVQHLEQHGDLQPLEPTSRKPNWVQP